ncbi:MAG: helix-turn-helix domain-containing protein [Tepidisphaeraceae bacterium]
MPRRRQTKPAVNPSAAPPPRDRFPDLRNVPLSIPLGSHVAEFLYWGQLGEKWWRNFLHVHSFFEICCAYDGAGKFRINGREHEVKAGDLFVAKPGEAHEIISSRRQPLGIYFWAYTLTRRGHPASAPSSLAMGPASSDSSRWEEVDALLDAFAGSKRWVSARLPAVGRTCELLTDEVVRCEAGFVRVVEGLVTKLLLDTARAVVDPATAATIAPVDPPAASGSEEVVRRVRAYLRDNYARAISVRDAAAQVHLSERHVARLFRGQTGASILEHLTALRLEQARQLLVDRRRTIKEVAAACGYPDVHYFTTLFGRHVGLTPAAFRRHRGTRFLGSTTTVEGH